MTRISLILLAALLLTACAGESAPLVAGNVVVTDARPGTGMRAGYFFLTNTTGEAIVITGVRSPQFAAVEMHETVLQDGVSRMRKLDSITLAPRQTIEFAPGARHLMLMRPTGDTEAVTLQFFAGDTPLITVSTSSGK